MNSKVEISEEELFELYEFMERANEFFHQPMNYPDVEKVTKFAEENYPVIRKYYYEVLWDKLPKELQDKILDE
ncbi:hypothetical protein EXU34_19980 [Alteromonas sp. ZYF713]|nr:hypothetical protein [Alteromonas sp. ZYF713]